MRAAIFRNGEIVVDILPEPKPAAGQVLVKTLACGICGSDLHARKHAHRMVELARHFPGRKPMDLARDVVFGHEFCCEVLDYGPATQRKLKAGTLVCSLPALLTAEGVQGIGYSNDNVGGYAERMLLSEPLLLEVPNGLAAGHAALTEPLAVGIHAVAKANIRGDEVPLVIGCGPVGLAVIAGLKIRGLHPIIAADYSPARRALAARLERLPEVQLPACRDLGDEARQPGQPVMPLRLTGNAPGQRLRHREVARLVHERNVSDRAGRSRVRCFPAPAPTRASYVDGAMRPYAVSVRSAWRVTTPRHSRVAASLGGSQVTGQPPSACWSVSRRSR